MQQSLEHIRSISHALHGRTAHHNTPNNSDIDQDHFVRKSLKYWVRERDVPALLSKIVQHLPLYVYNDSPSTPMETEIHSVYFERPDFKTYVDRMNKGTIIKTVGKRTKILSN